MDDKKKQEVIRTLHKMRDEMEGLLTSHASRVEWELFAVKYVTVLDSTLITLST
jgi:hypothetical protein